MDVVKISNDIWVFVVSTLHFQNQNFMIRVYLSDLLILCFHHVAIISDYTMSSF